MVDQYKKFCVDICNECKTATALTAQSIPQSFEICHQKVAACEIEGECMEWALQYLHKHNCPALLSVQIARAVADLILKQNENILAAEKSRANSNEITGHSDEKENDGSDLEEFDGVDAVTLVKQTVDFIHSVCEQWKADLPSNISLPANVTTLPVVSSHAIKNTRRKMEDKHVALPFYSQLCGRKELSAYYAVYDGHGGVDAAKYTSVHLHFQLAKALGYGGHGLDMGKAQDQAAHGPDMGKALNKAFTETDEMFTKCAQRQKYSSGTTAVCALVESDFVHIAWLGDSQAVLVRDGRAVQIMNPHKPEREDERKRIEALGGCVVWFGAWRVNGSLSVSRAIGDVSYKPYISGEPDVISVERDASDDYLVLACDGLWDTLSFDDLVDEVHRHLKESGGDKTSVAQHIVKVAKDRGSSDNITALVVFLRDEISAPKSPKKDKSLKTSTGGGESHKERDDYVNKNQSIGGSGGVGSDSKLGNMSGHCDMDQSGSSVDNGDGEGKDKHDPVDNSSNKVDCPLANQTSIDKYGQHKIVTGNDVVILEDAEKSSRIHKSKEAASLVHQVAPHDLAEKTSDVISGEAAAKVSSDLSGGVSVEIGDLSGDASDELRRASQDSKQNTLDVSDEMNDEEWFGTASYDHSTERMNSSYPLSAVWQSIGCKGSESYGAGKSSVASQNADSPAIRFKN